MPRKKQENIEPYLNKVKDKKYPGGYKPNWYVHWSENRRTKRISTGTANFAIAERFLANFKQGLSAPPEETSKTVTWIINEYLAYKKHKHIQVNADPKNFEGLEYKLKSPKKFFGNLHPDQISRKLGREYEKWRRKIRPGISNATIANELAIFNAAMNYAFKEEWISKLIPLELPPPPPPRQRRMNSQEKRDLIDFCHENHVKLFSIIALTTASRKSAILELKWDQVDLKNRTIDFNPPGRFVTKKRRVKAPINDLLYEHLMIGSEIAESEYVIEYKGKRVKDIKKGFQAATKRAGLEDVTPHICRHTAACDMAERKVPLEEIAALMGDRYSTVEKNYLKYTPDYLQNAVKALGEL